MRFLDILVVSRLDLGQNSFNLVKNAFATWQLALLATSVKFYDILARACTEIKISSFWTSRWPTSLGFLIFEFFPPFLFTVVIDLLPGLLAVQKLQRKRWDKQFLPWSSQETLLQVFHSTFWAFLCVSQAPSGQSLWSGHHWKNLFLLQKLSIEDANFGQKWWHQAPVVQRVDNAIHRINRYPLDSDLSSG